MKLVFMYFLSFLHFLGNVLVESACYSTLRWSCGFDWWSFQDARVGMYRDVQRIVVADLIGENLRGTVLELCSHVCYSLILVFVASKNILENDSKMLKFSVVAAWIWVYHLTFIHIFILVQLLMFSCGEIRRFQPVCSAVPLQFGFSLKCLNTNCFLYYATF